MFRISPLSMFPCQIFLLKEELSLKQLLFKFSQKMTSTSSLRNLWNWTLKWLLPRISWMRSRRQLATKKSFKLKETGSQLSSRETRKSWRTSFWGRTTSRCRTDCSNWRAWSNLTKFVRVACQKSNLFWHVSVSNRPNRIKSSWRKEKSTKRPNKKPGGSQAASALQARCSWALSCLQLSDLFVSSIVLTSWRRNGKATTLLIYIIWNL